MLVVLIKLIKISFKKSLRVLCGESFPIDYPDSWYDFVTSGYFYTCAAFDQTRMAGVIIAENKSYKQVNSKVWYLEFYVKY